MGHLRCPLIRGFMPTLASAVDEGVQLSGGDTVFVPLPYSSYCSYCEYLMGIGCPSLQGGYCGLRVTVSGWFFDLGQA